MNKFLCKYGLFHVKPCIDEEPSGNDGWIMTAYAARLGFPIDEATLDFTYYDCAVTRPRASFLRYPGKFEPPCSRDVVLGLYILKRVDVKMLQEMKWNFSPYELPRFHILFSPIMIFLSLWVIGGAKICMKLGKIFPSIFNDEERAEIEGVAHRNSIWKGAGFPELWRFAFAVPMQDRAFMLRDSGEHVPLLYRAFEWFSKSFPSKSSSSRLIAWAKGYEPIDVNVFEDYFKGYDENPILRRVRDLR